MSTKMIWDSNPDVRKIDSKMLLIHYLLGISNFAKFRKNWLVSAPQMLRNILKSPTLQQQWK